jgi:hypothetical protein
MQERLFRFGVAGLTFILSIAFSIWYSGGDLGYFEIFTREKVLTIVVGIISAPAIGFIISSICKEIWEFVWPRQKYLFLRPNNEIKQDYLKLIQKSFPKASGIATLSENELEVRDMKTLFLNQQILLRQHDTSKEILAWVARRMDVVYAHISGFFSVILGLIFGFCIRLFASSVSNTHLNFYKALWILPIICYLYIAYRQAIRALNEANNLEKKAILFKEDLQA